MCENKRRNHNNSNKNRPGCTHQNNSTLNERARHVPTPDKKKKGK